MSSGSSTKGSNSCDVAKFPLPSSNAVEQAAHEAAVADGLIAPSGASDSVALTKAEENRAKKAGLRRGKWTTEEEFYANRLIYEFKLGLLPLTDGTTLRTFLSKLLNCDPMRISKKFVGQNCIGKQVFRRRQMDLEKLTKEQIEMSRKELADLERRFLERVAQTNRTKSSTGGKSIKEGKMDYEDENGNAILAPWMIPPDEASAASSIGRSIGGGAAGGSVGGGSSSNSSNAGSMGSSSSSKHAAASIAMNAGMNLPPGMDSAMYEQIMAQQMQHRGGNSYPTGQQQQYPFMQSNPQQFMASRNQQAQQGNSGQTQVMAPHLEPNSMAAMEFQQQLYNQYMMMAGGNPGATAAAAAAAAATFSQHQQAAATAANSSSNSNHSNNNSGMMQYPSFLQQHPYNMYQQQFQHDQQMNFNNSGSGANNSGDFGNIDSNGSSAASNSSSSAMQRVSSYDILSSIAQLNSTQSLDNLQAYGWNNSNNNINNNSSGGESSNSDKQNSSSSNGSSNSSGGDHMMPFNPSMGAFGDSMGWTASLSNFDNISSMNIADGGNYGSGSGSGKSHGSSGAQGMSGLAGLIAQSVASTGRQAALPYSHSKSDDVGYDLDEGVAPSQGKYEAGGRSSGGSGAAASAKDDKKKRRKNAAATSAVSASQSQQQYVRPPVVDMNSAVAMNATSQGAYASIPVDSMAMMAHMYQNSGDIFNNGSTAGGSKNVGNAKKPKSSSSSATSAAASSSSRPNKDNKETVPVVNAPSENGGTLTKNASIDDFWMLVNMGDLPQPEQDVLSNSVWPGKKNNAAGAAGGGKGSNPALANRSAYPAAPQSAMMNADMQAQMQAQMEAQMQMLQQQHMQQHQQLQQQQQQQQQQQPRIGGGQKRDLNADTPKGLLQSMSSSASDQVRSDEAGQNSKRIRSDK